MNKDHYRELLEKCLSVHESSAVESARQRAAHMSSQARYLFDMAGPLDGETAFTLAIASIRQENVEGVNSGIAGECNNQYAKQYANKTL